MAKKELKIGTLPISFSEIAKEPVKGRMFFCLIAVGYLYVDGKMNYNKQIEVQGKKIESLEAKIDDLSYKLKRSDSLLAASLAKLTTLQELGKIK